MLKLKYLIKTSFFLIVLILGINQINAQQTISIEAEGNLESPKPLACVNLSEVTNEHNPADILNGMRKCIALKEYNKAVKLFAISGVYGKYDTYRVKDKTAHQALIVLQQQIFSNINESEKNALFDHLKIEFKSGSDNLTQICQAVQKIGIPTYYPKYMVQHGIAAFTEKKGNGLHKKFDSKTSWDLALKNYLHCGE